MLTFALVLATWAGTLSAWVWWHYRDIERFERPWYAMLPAVNVLAALAIGAVAGWLWARGTTGSDDRSDRS